MNSNWFKLVMKMTKVEYGKNLLLKGAPIIFNKGGAKLKIGENVTIKSSFLSNLVGLYSRTIIVTRAPGAEIEIGDNVGLRIKRREKVKQMIEEEKVDKYVERNYKASTFLLLTITLASVGMIVATRGMSNIISESAMMSQVKHMILFAPIICIIVSLINVKEGNLKAKKYLYFIAFITIVVFLLYSGTMARFILLGAIMAVVSYALLDYKNKSLYFSLYIAGFFFAFSMLRQKNLFDGNLLSFVDFRQVDYDAYQIFILVVRYVKEYGISWGLNILSAVCCFIPRSIATWRMEATGGIVVSSAGSWFKNVSCPLQAEMYFAFGTFGVIILLILLPIALLFAESSMNNLQSVSIVAAFPIGVVIVMIAVSFMKDAKKYMESLEESAKEKVRIN